MSQSSGICNDLCILAQSPPSSQIIGTPASSVQPSPFRNLSSSPFRPELGRGSHYTPSRLYLIALLYYNLIEMHQELLKVNLMLKVSKVQPVKHLFGVLMLILKM